MKEKSFERKKELLEAALEEFTTRNFEDASLNGIIKNAGISKGTFYYHFRDKQALYIFLLESSVKTKWNFIKSRMEKRGSDCQEMDIFERFKLQARLGAEFAMAFPKYHKLAGMFAKEKGNEIYEIAKSILGNESESLLEHMLTEAIERGDFREGFSKAFVLRIVSYLLAHFDDIFNAEEDLKIERMVENLDRFVEFMKHGIGK